MDHMNYVKRYYTVVCLCVIFTQFSLGQRIAFQKIDSLLLPFTFPQSPGMNVAISQNGKLIYSKGIGYANLEYGIKNADSVVYSLASVAKQFTSACIWTLLRDQKLTLEDDIRMYIPELKAYDHTIQIKHLLNHSSGLSNYHTLMHLQGFDYDREYYDNQTILDLASKQKKLNHIPGEKIAYSNTNYTLLAIIIERISKQNLAEYAKEKLFQPIGMNATFIQIENNAVVKNRAVGYQKVDQDYIQNPRIQKSYGAGSMYSNSTDLNQWISVLNGKNKDFKDLATFLSTCETLSNGQKATYARGVMVDHYQGLITVSHSGSGWGEQTQLITIPEKELGIIVLANCNNINPTALSYEILDILLPESESNIKKSFTSDPKRYKAFTGNYREVNSDMRMEILLENDTLKAKGSQAKKAITLKEIQKNIFVRSNNESVKYDFTNRGNGALTVSFGGTPFHFERIQIQDANQENDDFTGDFFSEELTTSYRFFTQSKQLYVSFKNHEGIPLSKIQKDQFGNNDRTLYEFTRNKVGTVDGVLVSCDGTVKQILFAKN